MYRWNLTQEQRDENERVDEVLRLSTARGDWWRARLRFLRDAHPGADIEDLWREAYADQAQAILVTGECE